MNFADWYAIYPRKVSRKDAEKAWNQLTPEQQFAAFESLPIHVRYWKLSGTQYDFLPYPASWLRAERWTDELQMPETRRAGDEWMKSNAGIVLKAAEVGVVAKPGEDYQSLKARILAKVA